MHRINVRFQSQQGEPMLEATFLNEPLAGRLHFLCENFAPILRYPYEMIGDWVVGPRVLPVCRVLFIGV